MDSLDYDGLIIQLLYLPTCLMSTLIVLTNAPRPLLVLRLDLPVLLRIETLRTSLEDQYQVYKNYQISSLESGDVQIVKTNTLRSACFEMLLFGFLF